ncbi:MAG: amidophosphoribosyltransferase [Planctomycetota bacterium]
MCGFVGILCQADSLGGAAPIGQQIYEGLLSLQHRGQDAAGIVTFDGRFHLKKGNGLVQDIFAAKHMARLVGNLGLGHVRYPTIGAGKSDDAQPFQIHYPYGMAIAHNGNVTNYSELVALLSEGKKAHLNSNCDVEVILNMLALEIGRMGVPDPTPEVLFEAVSGIFERVKGSYSVVTLVANVGMLAFRDPFGVKPMIYGTRRAANGSLEYAVASENVALDILGFSNWIDVKPGEAILFSADREPVSKILRQEVHHPCIFEHVYFARPDTVMDGISVYKTRRRFGKALARRFKDTGLHVDVVIPVPDSACTAALTMAQELGVEYREGLVKNRYIGRTFIMAGQENRQQGIRRKLNAIKLEFEGKDVMLVDDSVVRGNTSKQIVDLARQAGARRVYFASCAPPIRFPCVYGIDMATRQELVARDRDVEEVCAQIGADYMIYQDLGDLVKAARAGNPEVGQFCTACFSGDYPTHDITPEMFTAIERERLGIQSGA